MKPFLAVFCVFLGANVVVAGVARAADRDDPEGLIAKGIDLRKRGQDFEAETYFQRAYQQGHTPRAAAQLGLVEHALSRWADAEKHLTEALDSGRDPWIRKVKATLEDSLRTVRANVGQIEVRGQPLGADVLINGKPVGKLPLSAPAHVGKGYAEVEVRASGYVTAKRTVTIEGGHFQPLFVTLDKEAALDAPPKPFVTARPTDGDVTSGGEPAKDLPAAGSGKGRPVQIAGAVLGVAGLAAIGLGIKTSVDVGNLQKSYDAEQDPARRPRLASDGDSASKRQWLWYGLGAAGVIGGVVLYFVGDAMEHRAPASHVSWAPLLTPDATGLAAALQF
jgi:hypothetical protein